MIDYDTERAKYAQHHSGTYINSSAEHSTELQNTPLFSLHAKYTWNANKQPKNPGDDYKTIAFAPGSSTDPFAQSALLGFHVGNHELIREDEPIMLNTNAPNSTFICGSQGSGKSYTLSCMLENCLLPDAYYGTVANPVAGVAFHYDAEGSNSLAEVATLCSRGINVKVLVSASNFHSLKEKYMALPGALEHLVVDTLAFKERDMTIERMYKLMAFSKSDSNSTPLYEQVINQILRGMGMANEKFTMRGFEANPELVGLDGQQKKMLNLRLDLLKSYLANCIKKDLRPKSNTFQPKPGELTIVDLTDPFVNPSTACTLFDIALSLFKQQSSTHGMIIVLDEAHRYMNETAAASKFTDSLLTTIRMQRHTDTRVVIATQEPTISQKLLDLCSTSIVHRFNSPVWFTAIKDHLAGASSLLASREESDSMSEGIVKLGVGESFVFSPSSYVCADGEREQKLGIGFMRMKTRSKKGVDSGLSKLAGDVAAGDSVTIASASEYDGDDGVGIMETFITVPTKKKGPPKGPPKKRHWC